MRLIAVYIDICRVKIDLQVNGYLWNKSNYWSPSCFGIDSSTSWLLQLHDYVSSFLVNIYSKGRSIKETNTLLTALRTYNGRISISNKVLEIIQRVIQVTGEVFKCSKDGRGFVVVNRRLLNNLKLAKGAKYLSCNQLRSYSTRNKKSESVIVQLQEEHSKELEILVKHWKNCRDNPNRIFYDLKGYLKLDAIWFAAYLKIKANRKTVGPDSLGVNILELKELTLKNQYSWNKRVMIPKPGQPGKMRPLGIPSINDRIIQEVLKTIIEPIYEMTFSETSHGFRPNRSCHTTLKYIKRHMKNSIWYIEGDIKGYFSNIDHKILMSIIEKRIKDPIILNLIRSGLKAKVFEGNKVFTPEIGSPQGGILSPLLSNIYLDVFDKYMKKINEEYEGSIRTDRRQKNYETLKLMREGNKKLIYTNRLPSRNPFQSWYRHVKYIRYADDFLIGITGSRKLAVEIKELIKNFLNDELKLTEKTHITHISKRIPFLGHLIGRNTYVKVNRRMTIPTLYVDMNKVILRLKERGVCDDNGNPIPCFRYLRYPQSETNNKINMMIRGLANWWKIASNRKQAIARIAYILRYSIAKVYAAKFKLPTVARVLKIGGNDLSKAIGNTKKSAVGVVDKKNTKIKGILYDRFFKIPK